MRIHKETPLLAGLAVLFGTTGAAIAGDWVLWYQQPASEQITDEANKVWGGTSTMTRGLPIGNGTFGGLILGAPGRERIILDQISLWTGNANPAGGYDNDDMGSYQVLGDLRVNLPGHESPTNYRRDLDISSALAHVGYTANGVKYSREIFSSHPAGVIALKSSADKPGSYTGSIELRDSHGAQTIAAGYELAFAGALNNGLKYECRMTILPDGGAVAVNGSSLAFKNCNGFVLLLAAGTDYAMDTAKHFRGEGPHARIVAELKSASKKSYNQLKAAHVKDFQALFNRVAVNFGESSAGQRALPIDRRRIAAGEKCDPELEALLFQYGRYLMISCSRPGGLPANLQGLWNDVNNPPWHADYHANINIQMNYWPAEVANLSECQLPFLDLVESQLPDWRKATAESPDWKTPDGKRTTRGFAIRTSHNIFGGLGWKWDKTANAWYCQHFWEHFAFTRDTNFLRTVAYPVMKETCEFWEDHLKALPDGRWVVPNGWSPEHGPDEDGVSYNQEIVWDLFDNYVRACDVLGIDKPYRDKIAGMRDELVTPGIGSWGQLLEWMTEKTGTNALSWCPELDTPYDHHRHTSHLFAVFPGHQIGATQTPALAKAAKLSLDARGLTGDVREWSMAWRTALYARLRDGEAAHRTVQHLFARLDPRRSECFTCPNLFGLHPPMQIDGNFGITAGICEMLLQSHDSELDLLPALPPEWPDGSVTGLRARGGFAVDENWRGGRLVSATIHSAVGGTAIVRYGGQTRDMEIPRNGSGRYTP